MPGKRKNAIERRLDLLTSFWEEFSGNSEARLLRWVADESGLQMLDLFFELQNEEQGSRIPDFFLPLHTPFHNPAAYGFELVEEIKALYAEGAGHLREAGLAGDWRCPPAQDGISDIECLLRCCFSLQQHYQPLMLHFALVLQPDTVTGGREWQGWLHRLLQWNLPAHFRLTTVDRAEAPWLEGLASSFPQSVVTVKPKLDMDAAVTELAGEARISTADGEFRRMFLEMANLCTSGDMEAVARRAQSALAIANRQNWPAMAFTTRMVWASALLRSGDVASSIAAYREASQDAERALQQGEASGLKLLIQSRFGEGSAWVSGGRFAQAAEVYAAVAPVTQQAADAMMELEAWRMAAYCYEQAGQREPAWRCGWSALAAAEKLEDAMLQNSTVSYAGEGLLRLAGASSHPSAGLAQIHERMRALLGAAWPHQPAADGVGTR